MTARKVEDWVIEYGKKKDQRDWLHGWALGESVWAIRSWDVEEIWGLRNFGDVGKVLILQGGGP
jgi:hypothetical protein